MGIRQLCAIVMVYCVIGCKRSRATPLEISNVCSCPYGCNFNHKCIPEGNCRKENVALGKTARMSSAYSDNIEPSGPACLAVNGNTRTDYIPTTQENPNCIHTDTGDHNAWWEVDLGRNYIITELTVYIRLGIPERMDNVRITVDGTACYTFPNGTANTPPGKNVFCISPVEGSVVRLSKSTADYYLNICEVQVWGCSSGYYGINCILQCGRCTNNSSCHPITGQCTAGCQTRRKEPMCSECYEGYYGINCDQECGNCNDGNTCNSTNGHCFAGCKTGWKEPMCTVCRAGIYGANCNQTCGKCRNSLPCNATDGVCLEGCQDGYKYPFCNEKCSSGTWGRNCQNTCGACLEYACRYDNGTCEKGCFSGYEGDNCTVLLQQSSERDETGAIVGSVLGAGLFIGCSIAFTVLIWLRRSTKGESPHVSESKDMNENQEDLNDVSEDMTTHSAEHGRENHCVNDYPSTVVDDNYEEPINACQNASSDTIPYEILMPTKMQEYSVLGITCRANVLNL